MPADYPTSSRTLFYSILSTNHILSNWLNMVWVHANHNSLSLLNKAQLQRSHACGILCNSNFYYIIFLYSPTTIKYWIFYIILFELYMILVLSNIIYYKLHIIHYTSYIIHYTLYFISCILCSI